MKKMFHIIALGSICLFWFSYTALGQNQKIGYVNTDFIIQQMPEYEGVAKQLQQLSNEWKAALDEKKNEIERLKKEFEAKKILYTDEVRAQNKQLIQQKVEARNQFLKQKFGPDGDYFKMQKELLKPIQRKIFEAIIAVSQQLNIDFVFDRAKSSSLLYARQQWNLNQEILSELGITLNQ